MTETIDLLVSLIRNQCVNDGTVSSGHEHRSVETLQAYLDDPGTVFEPAPGRQSVVYRVKGTDPDAASLMLMGHTDVVPADPSGWSVDPFGGEIAGGFVWGRGAVDMLNLTASMATVFRPYLQGEADPLPGDLVFLAVADEENAGGLGARPLVADRWDLVHCDNVLTEIAYPPIDTVDGVGYPVAVGEKGPHWTRMVARGTPGHGSVPYGADNALAPLVEALHGLFTTPALAAITDEWRQFVGATGLDDALLDADLVDEAIERLAATDPRMAAYVHACTHLTVSPNVLTGGVKANMVADWAEAQVDLRALPGQTRDDVDQFLGKAMGSARDRVELVPVADHPANATPTAGALWETIVDALDDVTGSRNAIPTMMPATTDARFFRRRGVTAYGVGLFDRQVTFPDFLAMFHGHDERVSVDSVDLTTRLLTVITQRWRERTSR
ncbi:MAG: M20/M25/M40 family metallo-hydrolase [Acidimicrobiia bacterium]|nr:M20/M25/M40 family metallo-hydrolase [Acidimicrobiia bacterium]